MNLEELKQKLNNLCQMQKRKNIIAEKTWYPGALHHIQYNLKVN